MVCCKETGVTWMQVGGDSGEDVAVFFFQSADPVVHCT